MILLRPSVKIESPVTFDLLCLIEDAGRTCYKSEDAHEKQVDALEEYGECTDPDCNGWSAIPREEAERRVTEDFVLRVIKSGHHSVIEHASVSVRFICDRGVTHELVRHRLAAFSQENTRYVNYGKRGGCQFIIPPWFDFCEGEYSEENYSLREFSRGGNNAAAAWLMAMYDAERCYLDLLKSGQSPQQARSVLPNSTKTEIVMTANLREWRHVLKLRTGKAAHPQMREIMLMLLKLFKESPVACVFEDINAE